MSATATAGPPAVARPRGRRWSGADDFYRGTLATMAALVLAIAALIVWEMARGALPSLHAFGLRFLLTTSWDPVAERFGALPYVYGTLVSSALALLLALPVGLG